MTKQNNKPQNAMQVFGLRYPPFADTFDVLKPFRKECYAFNLCRIVITSTEVSLVVRGLEFVFAYLWIVCTY